MHGGARAGAGRPIQNKGTPQLFSGPSLSVPGVSGSSKTIHPLFRGNNNNNQVGPISDASFDVQYVQSMEDVMGSEHSPAATCEFQSS